MDKKIKTVRFIPAIVVDYPSIGSSLETSGVLYEDLFSATQSLQSMIKLYESYDRCRVLRSSVIRKVIEL